MQIMKTMNFTYFNLAAKRLLCDLALSIDVSVVIFDEIIVLAREPGEKPFSVVFDFIGGLSDVGVDSVELCIGDSDGTCACLIVSVFGGFAGCTCCGGGDGVIDRDSVRRVYLSGKFKNKIFEFANSPRYQVEGNRYLRARIDGSSCCHCHRSSMHCHYS